VPPRQSTLDDESLHQSGENNDSFDNNSSHNHATPDLLTLTVVSPFGFSENEVNSASTSHEYNSDSIIDGAVSSEESHQINQRLSMHHPSSPSSSATGTSGLVRQVESKLLGIIQDELERKTPVNPYVSQSVDFQTEESILTLVKSIDNAADLTVCMDLIDCAERFGVFQYPCHDTVQPNLQLPKQQDRAPSNPLVKAFCSKLESLRLQALSTSVNANIIGINKSALTSPSDIGAGGPNFESLTLSSSPSPGLDPSFSKMGTPMGLGGGGTRRQQLLISVIEFSINFHQVIANKLLSFGRPTYKLALKRMLLLDCFELLRQQCIPPTTLPQPSIIGVDPTSLARNDASDFMDVINLECRKNTLKAEALCWAMRVRRAVSSQHNPHAITSHSVDSSDTLKSTPTSSSTSSMTGSAVSGGIAGSVTTKKIHKPLASSYISPQPGPRYNAPLMMSNSPKLSMSSTTRKSISNMINEGSPVPVTPSSSSVTAVSSFDLWATAPDEVPVSFSVFIAFVDSHAWLRSQLVLTLLDAASNIDQLVDVTQNRKNFPNVGRLLESGDYRLSTVQFLSDEYLGIIGDENYRSARWQQAYDSVIGNSTSSRKAAVDLPAGLDGSGIDGAGPSLQTQLSYMNILSMSIDNMATASVAGTSFTAGPPQYFNNFPVVHGLLSMLWSPSLLDSFNLQLYSYVLGNLGLDKGWRLHATLPLLLQYFERLPFIKLALYMTTFSPIQR
jgi:hypothetical protein